MPELTLPPGKPRDLLQTLLREASDGPRSIAFHREMVDEFGWRNYGDVFADHEQLHYAGPRPLVSHYNNQFDLLQGMLLHFLRAGAGHWWEWADALARHVVDIDIYHTVEDRAAYNGGMFWFTDHYLHAHTATHRTYSRHNRLSWSHAYGGGPSPEHNFTTGLLLHHALTGSRDSREAVISLANWVIAMDDGRRTVLGVIDDGPTGLATGASAKWQPIGRAAGNSINALLDAWTLTTDPAYLDNAEVLIRRSIHPHDDIATRDLLNVERNWSYTVFLRSLAKYLELKEEAGPTDFMFCYARAALVHYARWMLEHERPYFDQVEQLEFPTETWAAQEFRKANVLRLAARYVDQPLRMQLVDRGNDLADRAWHDLCRFETRASARAVAIVMIEGLLDARLRSHAILPAPCADVDFDFGQPTNFVPQRQRVKLSASRPNTWVGTLSRAVRPVRWYRYFCPQMDCTLRHD